MRPLCRTCDKKNSSSVRSGLFRPDGAFGCFGFANYKDSAPLELGKKVRWTAVFNRNSVRAMAAALPIPKELTSLIENGFWPRDPDEARGQNLHPLILESSVRRFAPEESKIYFLQPPFYRVRDFIEGAEWSFWSDSRTAIHEIDPDLTLLIGDFGPGSEAPIALDYRQRLDQPRVIRLRWASEGNHWIEIAPTFAEFAVQLK